MIIGIALVTGAAVLLLTPPLLQGVRSLHHWFLQYTAQTAHGQWGDLFLFIPERALYIFFLCWTLAVGLLWWVWDLIPIVAALAIVVGVLLPALLRRLLKHRRQQAFLLQLPDALLALAGLLRTGVGFQAALERVVRDAPLPLKQEFGLVLRELRMGHSLATALEGLEQRCPDEDLRLLVAGVLINREVGGSLSELLNGLAEVSRRKQIMRGRIDVLTAQGRMQGWVMSALPLLIGSAIWLLEPQAMSILFREPVGWVVLTISAVFLAIGAYLIHRIVSIDI